MADHPQIHNVDIGVDVDQRLTALLSALVRSGCRTRFSCQGDPGGRGYIAFADGASLERSLWLLSGWATAASANQLRGRIVGVDEFWIEGPDGPFTVPVRNDRAHLWTVEAHPSFEFRCGHDLADAEQPMQWELRFPHEDLDDVNALLSTL